LLSYYQFEHFSSSCILTTTTEQGFSGKKEKKKIEFIVISFLTGIWHHEEEEPYNRNIQSFPLLSLNLLL
jgi:hypothetical protein